MWFFKDLTGADQLEQVVILVAMSMAKTPIPWEAGDIANSFHTSLTGTAGMEEEISDGEAIDFPLLRCSSSHS
jgi:hypothetical protein